ncbi:IniB N-terminal domain-containing protein, partial [Mycobacterium tuberculosis]
MTSLIDYILSLFRSEDAARSFVAAPGRAMTSAGLIDIAPHQISSVAANVVPGLNLGAGDPMSGLRQAVAARHGFAQDVANVGFAGDAGAGVASVITTDVGAGLASGLGAGFLGQGGLALAASSGGFGGQVGLAAQVGLGFTAVIEAEVGAQVGAGLGIGTGLGAQAGMGFGGGVGLGLGGQAGGVIGGSAAGAIGAGVGGRLGGNGQIGVAGQGAVGAGVGAGVGGQAGIASQIGVSAGGGLGGVGNVSGLTGVSSNAVLASNAAYQLKLFLHEKRESVSMINAVQFHPIDETVKHPNLITERST